MEYTLTYYDEEVVKSLGDTLKRCYLKKRSCSTEFLDENSLMFKINKPNVKQKVFLKSIKVNNSMDKIIIFDLNKKIQEIELDFEDLILEMNINPSLIKTDVYIVVKYKPNVMLNINKHLDLTFLLKK